MQMVVVFQEYDFEVIVKLGRLKVGLNICRGLKQGRCLLTWRKSCSMFSSSQCA